MEANGRIERRLNDLELLFTHLERQVAELHEVILRQQQTIERIEQQARRFSQAQQDDQDAGTEP